MNQQQKYILNLQRKSRERKREQAFVIEGRKMFEEAPADRVKMIVASESFCKSKEGAALLKGKKFDVVSDSIFETLSDTKTPQGILAVVKQQPYSFEELLGKDRASFLLILDHLQDPGNLGTILRTVDSIGLNQIIVSKGTADAFNSKVVRSTMGAIFRIKIIEVENLAQAIKEMRKHHFKLMVTSLQTKNSIYDIDFNKKIIVIGNEANGVSKEIQDMADEKAKIPMLGRTESLNASVAAGVVMYEYVRQKLSK